MDILEQINYVKDYCDSNAIFYKQDYSIKAETYFKMCGNIKLFISPQDYLKFRKLIIYINQVKISYKIIGFTSNVLLFNEIEYSIIISTKSLTYLQIFEDIITVDTGYSVQEFVRVIVMNQAKGFEGLEGIPATIGGALLMNAGAYGYSISDNLLSVECINEKNEFQVLTKEECDFVYRNSIFKNGKYVILRASFKLIKGDRKEIARNIETFHIARHSYQDFVYPNLGSMLSLNGDIYHEILKKNRYYNFLYWTIKYLFKNPISKFFNRKRPNNVIFNKLLLKYLDSQMNIKLNYTMSTKSANILVNDGTVDAREIVDYIFLIHGLMNKKIHIENELVLEPAYSVQEEFKSIYQEMNKLKEYN